MANHYAVQQVGVSDGSQVPPARADGREVNFLKRGLIASKLVGQAWASGDTVVLGKKPANAKITDIKLCTGTSLGTATVSIGIAGTAAKYASAKTLTTTNTPTSIGPIASTMDDAPGDEEELIATIGVDAIADSTALTFVFEFATT